MSYDAEGSDGGPIPYVGEPADPKDLETIVQLLELAAISLTGMNDQTFSFDALFAEAQEFGGKDVVLNRIDAHLVARFAAFLKKEPGGRYSLK